MQPKRVAQSFSKSNTAILFNRYVWLVDTIYRAGRISRGSTSGGSARR